MQPIKLIIADDHQIFIDGLKALLIQDDRFHVIGEVTNGQDLLVLLTTLQVDIIIMDINMPYINGVEATREIAKLYPAIRILILTLYNKKEFIAQTIAAGASGYILKNCSKNELVEALLSINANNSYFSKGVTEVIMNDMKDGRNLRADPLSVLSKREVEVLKLISQEYSTKEISSLLSISEHTVDTHRKNLLSKINAKNIAGLVRFAIENNIIHHDKFE